MSFSYDVDPAFEALTRNQLRTARTRFDELLPKHAEHRSFIAYNLGVIHHRHTANGDEARRCFELAWENAKERRAAITELRANAAENMLLLSLSNEEHTLWTQRLAADQPGNPILAQAADIQEAIDNGHRWHEAMLTRVAQFVEGHQFGLVASTCQLILNHRKELRMPREGWRQAVTLYGSAVTSLVGALGQEMEAGRDPRDPAEFLFIAAEALPALKEFISENPGDADVQGLIDRLTACLGPPPDPGDRGGGTAARRSGPTGFEAPVRLLAVAAAGWWGSQNPTAGPTWGAILGAVIGLVLIAPLVLIGIRWATGRTVFTLGQDGGSGTQGAEWHFPPDLRPAIEAEGLGGLAFALKEVVVVPDGTLVFTFSPQTPVGSGLEKRVGLALRCVVAQTLLAVAAGARGVSLADEADAYRVRLGPGVDVLAPMLRFAADQTRAIEATSDQGSGSWTVTLRPRDFPTDRMAHARHTFLHSMVFGLLLPGFLALRSRPVQL